MTDQGGGLTTRIDMIDDRLTPRGNGRQHGVAITGDRALIPESTLITGYVNGCIPAMKAAITHSELKR